MITAEQLIEVLRTLDPKTEMLTRGYESGYDPIKSVVTMPTKVHRPAKDYYGVYDYSESGDVRKAVLLFGNFYIGDKAHVEFGKKQMTWGEFKKLVDETEGMSDEEKIWYIDVSFPDFADVSVLVNDNACGVSIS